MISKFRKCKYLDKEGLLTCNVELNDCKKCELKENSIEHQLINWFFGVCGVILVSGILLYIIELILRMKGLI